MEYTHEIVLYSAGAVALVWILISVFGSQSVLSLGDAGLEPLGDEEARECLTSVISQGVVDTQWAADHDFQPTGAYTATNLPGEIKVVVWTRANEPTYLCVYVIPEMDAEMDFVTVCDEKILTTGTTKDGQLLPNTPESWLQTFSRSSASELWSRHQDALNYLSDVASFQPDKCTPNLQDHFACAMRRQAEHVRSLRLWPLRMPYWYFVRRNTRHNKSIRQLIET